jgi:hypothetical protein
MHTSTSFTADCAGPFCFELWFEPLAHGRRGFAFVCDPSGRIDLDALSSRGRANYMLARTLVGRDFASPQVVRRNCGAHLEGATMGDGASGSQDAAFHH